MLYFSEKKIKNSRFTFCIRERLRITRPLFNEHALPLRISILHSLHTMRYLHTVTIASVAIPR